ncbi:LysM peptidoglycan-binding domain-containing protein [bacterium]|nr:LysM peptidoglycan-binding domain-containing protein [bacterium]
MSKKFYILTLLILISHCISCSHIQIPFKSEKKASEAARRLQEREALEREIRLKELDQNNENIELSQEFYQNAIYKMENDDLAGALSDFDAAFQVLRGCEFDESKKEIERELYGDIFNQLVSIIYTTAGKDWQTGEDIKPDDFLIFTEDDEDSAELFSNSGLKEKLVGLDQTFDIPVEINSKVLFFLAHFTNEYRQSIQKALDRSAQYLPYMIEIFQDNGMPLDLCYLPIIESAFKVKAVSRAQASGLWQFMSFTGKKYGLTSNSFIDERFDPFKSTIAACDYLKELYSMFNDWYLALASYNVGENKVMFTVKTTGVDNYWEMSKTKYLPRETKEYVPRFLAALIIAKNPEKFGFTKPPPNPLKYDIVDLEKPLSLHLISKHCDVSIEELRQLNPELKTNSTPSNMSSYSLRIPEGKKDIFLAKYKELEKRGLLSQLKHHVKNGETLSSIARQYNVSISALIESNSIDNPHRISANKYLTIPSYGSERYSPDDYEYKGSSKKTEYMNYKVKPGDSIYKIALAHKTDVETIMKFNNLKQGKLIHPGDFIKIPTYYKNKPTKSEILQKNISYQNDQIIYEVKSGDSLYTISKKFECTVDDIKKWNSITGKKILYPGDKLYIENLSRK